MPVRPFSPGELIRTLARHDVEFVLIGGLGGMVHGSSLPSYDLDVIYRRTPENLDRLAAVLKELGATLRGAPEDLPCLLDAQTLRAGLNFTFDTRYGAFDILGEAAGAPRWAELRGEAELCEIEGEPVWVASLDHLIAMKRASGRTKDDAHLSEYIALAEEEKRRK